MGNDSQCSGQEYRESLPHYWYILLKFKLMARILSWNVTRWWKQGAVARIFYKNKWCGGAVARRLNKRRTALKKSGARPALIFPGSGSLLEVKSVLWSAYKITGVNYFNSSSPPPPKFTQIKMWQMGAVKKHLIILFPSHGKSTFLESV